MAEGYLRKSEIQSLISVLQYIKLFTAFQTNVFRSLQVPHVIVYFAIDPE